MGVDDVRGVPAPALREVVAELRQVRRPRRFKPAGGGGGRVAGRGITDAPAPPRVSYQRYQRLRRPPPVSATRNRNPSSQSASTTRAIHHRTCTANPRPPRMSAISKTARMIATVSSFRRELAYYCPAGQT